MQLIAFFYYLILIQISRISYQDGQCTNEESIGVGNQPNDLSLAPLSPGLFLVAFESGVVFLRGEKVVSTINLGFTVTALAVTPDGTEAIVGGQDGKLHLYSVNGDSLTEEAILERHRGAISVIRYSPDLSMFASADLNREAVVWDRASREVTKDYLEPDHESPTLTLILHLSFFFL